MRAVSSPSLCESPLDAVKCSKKPRRDEIGAIVETHKTASNSNNNNGTGTGGSNSSSSAGSSTTTSVLQKFRKTFSNLKGRTTSMSSSNGPSIGSMNGGSNHVSSNSIISINSVHSMVNAATATAHPTFDNADIIKYRFGPLIWRTSKERRKTKHHRRDKCNSGDSGIQVELENDENCGSDMIDSLDASPSFTNVRVRRANSAKVASNTMAAMAKARVFKRNDTTSDKPYLTSIAGRSLSQPYGLNHIAPCK